VIATTRGLAILAGIAALLVAVLLLASPREAGPTDRSLVPGFDAANVNEIVIARGDVRVRLVRVEQRWEFAATAGDHHGATVADPAAIDAIFTALRGGRWHRRAAASAAGAASGRSITFGGTTLAIGAALPGTGQTWIVRGGDALLVDSWVATALSPEPLALHTRQALDCAAGGSLRARTLDGRDVAIEGGRLVAPRGMWLDEGWLARLATACAAVEIVALPDPRTKIDSRDGANIAANGTTLRRVGTCEQGRVLVATGVGAGCVDGAALHTVEDLLVALGKAPHDAIDLRPLPIDPVKLTLQDGSLLDLTGKPRIGDVDADPDAVRALLAALTRRGEAALPRPATKPTATIHATDRAGVEVALELFADRTLGRAGEPGAIRVEPAAWDIVTRGSAALRDPTRWREDATTLTSLTLDQVTYKRGAVLGEWTREPAGTFDPALVDALAEALAHVRAPTAAPPRAIAHRIAVTFTPPAGAATTHVVELAPPTGDGCAARIDKAPVVLPLPLCTAAVALASQR
jgi:hypothetical protein